MTMQPKQFQFPSGQVVTGYGPDLNGCYQIPDNRGGFYRIDGYGNVINQGGQVMPQVQSPYYSQSAPMSPTGGAALLRNPAAGARVQSTDLQEMFAVSGGRVYRRPFYPTMPMMFQGGATFVRVYGCTLLPDANDYTVNGAAYRQIKFDMPVVCCALTGGAFNTDDGNALPVGVNPLDTFGVQFQYGTNDTMTTDIRIARTCLGTGERPAQVGGNGWVLNTGTLINVTIVPFMPNLRIDIAVWCLESRAGSNFTVDDPDAMPT